MPFKRQVSTDQSSRGVRGAFAPGARLFRDELDPDNARAQASYCCVSLFLPSCVPHWV